MSNQDQILLQTKLHRPPLSADVLMRGRLIELLDHEADRQLILVCAPAGFGKTTLIGSWLDRMSGGQSGRVHPLPSAWLSLDEGDSDLTVFIRYCIAALRTIFNEVCEETLALLQARQQPPPAVLYTTFSNELEKLPGEVILVLDDYHTVRNPEVHNLLSELARHWPKPLHLVLISRISPPIPLDSLRAKGMISEIRTRDLRFTAEETADYLKRTQFALMRQYALPLLEERFEGWPAGLHLAALSLRNADSQESVLMALSSENPDITGYLMDEVLTHQFPAVHTFLLKTSILDRFCASLCEAVIGEVDAKWNARTCLESIERAELFLIPLDNRREWYRFHHLFHDLLQQRLSIGLTPDQVANLHRQASAWFEAHGLLEEALHHTLAAGDLELAARQMISGLCDVLNREDRSTLERWLRLLPEEMIQRNPELLMIRVWALQFAWRIDLQAQVMQQVEGLLGAERSASLPEDELQLLCGQIIVLKSQQLYFSNLTTRAIDLCRQALAVLPPSWIFVRGGAMMYLGMSMQAIGQSLEAERLLLAEYESYGEKNDSYALFLLLSLGFTYLNSGQLEQTRRIAQVLLQAATRSRIAIMKNWGDWFLGVVSYQLNELEVAAQHFAQIFENRYTAQIAAYRDAVTGLAFIHQIQGENSKAWQVLESISQFDLELSGSEDLRTSSLRARMMLWEGDLERAGRWADAFTDLPPDQALLWLEEPQVTRVRVLLARGAAADLRLANKILDVLDEIADRTHNSRYKIEILALLALALNAQGKTSKAYAILKQAVNLARPAGFIRCFVDLGKPMQKMFLQLAGEDHSLEAIHRILEAFPADDKNLVNGISPMSKAGYRSISASALAEPLTSREFEILGLLRGPLSMKEIALKLNISYATVKSHTINVYAKLGVNQRWKAVARAEELNILPPR